MKEISYVATTKINDYEIKLTKFEGMKLYKYRISTSYKGYIILAFVCDTLKTAAEEYNRQFIELLEETKSEKK